MTRKRIFLSRQVVQRVADVDKVYVPHEHFTAVLEAIGKSIETVGSRKLPMCSLAVGPSGVGKSLIIDKIKEAFEGDEEEVEFVEPPYPSLVARHVPVLSIEMPERPHSTAILNLLLKEFGDLKWRERDPQLAEDRVIRFIKACRTRGILLDEAQRIVDRTSDVLTHHILDTLKRLASASGVSLVFLGVGRLEHVMNIDGQIRRRWKLLRFDPYVWPSDERTPFGSKEFKFTPDQKQLIAVYRAMEKMMPIPTHPEVSVLNCDDKSSYRACRRFTYANRGAIGLHKQLLLGTMEESEGFQQITMKLFAKAYAANFKDEPGVVNPFTEQWVGQPPPPIRDDVLLLHPRRKLATRCKPTKRSQARELAAALTK